MLAKIKTAKFDSADHLTSKAAQQALLKDALATGHAGYIAAALGTIARVRGISQVAKETVFRSKRYCGYVIFEYRAR